MYSVPCFQFWKHDCTNSFLQCASEADQSSELRCSREQHRLLCDVGRCGLAAATAVSPALIFQRILLLDELRSDTV